jgi:membrane protein DedA with SNARE-associated domain
MNSSYLIQQYGYLIIYLGGVFEGESVALLGGYAARTQGLTLPLVMLCSILGVFTSDQFCFYLGRFLGPQLVRKWPRIAACIGPFTNMIDRHRTKLILTFQYFPGAGTVVPIALGMSTIPSFRYLWLDFISSTVWGILIPAIGFGFGAVAQTMLGQLQGALGIVIGVVIVCGFFIGKRKLTKTLRASTHNDTNSNSITPL